MRRDAAMAKAPIETCDVWELARQRRELGGELPLAQAERLVSELFDAAGVLRFRLRGYVDQRGRTAAALELNGTVRARCDRCGGPVEVPIAERALFYFVADEAELASLPIDDAPDEPLLGARRFDVAGLVEDQAILALPISPRHADCAAPTLADEGPPAEGPSRRPFAALAELKRRRH
jgi:uncharacterized protein